MKADFTKIIPAQSELDHDINKKYGLRPEDTFAQKVLSILVENGECANNWRGFKFWSEDQEPRYERTCHVCNGLGEFHHQVFSGPHHIDDEVEGCMYCEGTGVEQRPLLEEYVDGLKFIVSQGLDNGFMPSAFHREYEDNFTTEYVTEQYIEAFATVIDYWRNPIQTTFIDLLSSYLELGHVLGFDWDQIEEAYFQKHEINLKRLESGY